MRMNEKKMAKAIDEIEKCLSESKALNSLNGMEGFCVLLTAFVDASAFCFKGTTKAEYLTRLKNATVEYIDAQIEYERETNVKYN